MLFDGRIIPAHAGNSPRPHSTAATMSDHPRACGELFASTMNGFCFAGSSPRMRGTPDQLGALRRRHRIIPAHAGNSSWRPGGVSGNPDHPRACGELGLQLERVAYHVGSSPRMRGTLLALGADLSSNRIIPAHAGNSPTTPVRGQSRADHPRACGELERVIDHLRRELGSSPRMRGTLRSLVSATPRSSDHPRACGAVAACATIAGRFVHLWPVREPRRTGGRCPATAAPGHAPVPGGRAPLRDATSYEAEG